MRSMWRERAGPGGVVSTGRMQWGSGSEDLEVREHGGEVTVCFPPLSVAIII